MNSDSKNHFDSRISERMKSGWAEDEARERGGHNPLRLFAILILFILLYVFPFYAPEGYLQITTHKFRFLKLFFGMTAVIALPFFVVNRCQTVWGEGFSEGLKTLKKTKKPTDLFVDLFLVANLLSYCFSEYKADAFWGAEGWYTGLFLYLGCFMLYFIFSLGGIEQIVPELLFLPSAVIFLWGILNRFSVFPSDMKYYEYDFISCLGNINWFAGYWSFFMAGAVAWYLLAEKTYSRVLAGIYLWITLLAGLLQGSDAAFVVMAVLVLFFGWICFENETRKKRYTEMVILGLADCLGITVADALFPGHLISLSKILVFLVQPWMVIPLLFFVLIRLSQEKKTGGEKMRNIHFAVAAALLTTALVLLLVNTFFPGRMGPLSNVHAFSFDNSWSGRRGTTWSDGIRAFGLLRGGHKLVGAGPDCFYSLCYSNPETVALLDLHYSGNVLTNAHNECITMLVNQGIIGTVSYLGMLFVFFREWMRHRKEQPELIGFAAALLAYFTYNMFSFQQILTLPLLFVLLGMGRYLLRNKGEESTFENPV